jgi:hypothetical protein
MAKGLTAVFPENGQNDRFSKIQGAEMAESGLPPPFFKIFGGIKGQFNLFVTLRR